MNILSYKKPAFWVVIAAVIAVAAVCLGLMSNPKKEQMTVEDYANQFFQQELDTYNQSTWEIMDSKITKLEKITSFDELYTSEVEIWSIEYRIKPDDIDKVVVAGGVSRVDGWITEESSRGKPVLVFARDDAQLQYLGCMWIGERIFDTLAQKETEVRMYLESINLLPHETYSGNHILVKFPMSSGDTAQLFLSQPVIQGETGIWCVERWMDTNGNEYHVTPETEMRAIDYYKAIQKQCDDGHQPSLLDPIQVASHYINQNVSLNKLDVNYSATVEDFLETPESHYIGFIMTFSVDEPSFHFDLIEWLTDQDTERLKQLNIDINDMPNGYYIYNPATYPMYCAVTEDTQYSIVDWQGNGGYKTVDRKAFYAYLNQYSDATPPFRLVTKDGYVQSITEQFVN